MKGYVSIHRIADGQILANMKKFRIYARVQGFISEGFFNSGQAALDAAFAIQAFLSPHHIDYILDMRFSDPWPYDILDLWKKKALEIFSKYPQVCAVGITDEDSPFWVQISGWRELFERYGDRILGTFKSPDEAEEFLDKLRNTKSS